MHVLHEFQIMMYVLFLGAGEPQFTADSHAQVCRLWLLDLSYPLMDEGS